MDEFVVACTPAVGEPGREPVLLVQGLRTLRALGGRLAAAKVWVLEPGRAPLGEQEPTGLDAQGAEVIPEPAFFERVDWQANLGGTPLTGWLRMAIEKIMSPGSANPEKALPGV